MAVVIPISTKYDGGKGFTEAEKDARRAAAEAAKLAREQERSARAATAAQDRAVRDQVKALNYRDNLVRNSMRMEEQGKKKLASLTAGLDRSLAADQAKAAETRMQWATASLVAFGAITKAGADAVNAARESAAAERELLGVLNSTGKAADGFKESLNAQSAALEDNSNFTDEAVSHAQALLLTFEKVGGDVIPRATQATADLAQLMGGDLQSAAIQVGKALDGQVSALKRSGVSFTDAQEEQIAALFKSGRAAEAQNIILAQLEKQVGGQAKAAREAAGGWKDMEVSAGKLQEAMGKLLLTVGDGGATQAGANFLDRLTGGADAWSSAIENMRLLAEARERAAKNAGIQGSAPRGALGQVRGDIISQEDLATALQEVVKEHEAAKKAAEDHAKTLIENTQATDDNAAAADDLARKLEAANQARRGFAGDLIDITNQAAADTQATWDDYFKEEQSAWQDHSKAVEKINADSEKERVQIQKDLAKALSDIDKGLTKDLAKLDRDYNRERSKVQRDGNRQISRMVEDSAREEKQQRRQRQIDAKADQRLFDYDMRQLAAEGEFNQIQQAMERRAIEQQVQTEQQAETDRQRQEDSRLEVQRAREDMALRLAEMAEEKELRKQELQDRAAEERQMAQEKAAEAEAQRQEELAQALADEQANYEERMEALRQNRDEKLAAIEEGEAAALEKLAASLVESGDLTKEEMEKLVPIAREKGERVGAAFAEGMNEAYAREAQIDQMLGNSSAPASSAPSRPSSRPGAVNQVRTRPNANSIYGFADGTPAGGLVVPPGYPDDSYLIGLTSGERFSVAPAGQSGGAVIHQTINVNGIGGDDLAAFVAKRTQAAAAAAVEEYHDSVVVPWSNN